MTGCVHEGVECEYGTGCACRCPACGADGVSCLDPRSGRPRLLAEPCPTCVYHPGNLMGLAGGALRDLTLAGLDDGAQGVICHDTLAYGRYADADPAMCRGFHDRFGDQSGFIRVARRIGGFTEVRPPGQTGQE